MSTAALQKDSDGTSGQRKGDKATPNIGTTEVRSGSGGTKILQSDDKENQAGAVAGKAGKRRSRN